MENRPLLRNKNNVETKDLRTCTKMHLEKKHFEGRAKVQKETNPENYVGNI